MKPDAFEQRLSRQPLKPLPGEWRAEILAVAREARVMRHSSFVIRHSWLATLLWPHPKAWAGLAAVWLVILALNFSMRDTPPVVAKKFTSPSPTLVAELRREQKMLAELIGPADLSVADRPRILFPKPRSERVEMLAA